MKQILLTTSVNVSDDDPILQVQDVDMPTALKQLSTPTIKEVIIVHYIIGRTE